MALVSITIGPLTATQNLTDSKAQSWARLLYDYDPLPSSDSEGNPLSYTNQEKLDRALHVMLQLVRATIVRQREAEMLSEYSTTIQEALGTL